MASTPLNIIYGWFETGDFPTEEQFKASWASFWHKSEDIPMSAIFGLNAAFQNTVTTSTFNNHANDPNAHGGLASRNASNLTEGDVLAWQNKLEIGELPDNIATYNYEIHDHVMMKDGTTKEAGDLGKNVANSFLPSVTGAGLSFGALWKMQTNGYPYQIEGLADKSTDSTYNQLFGINPEGFVTRVDGKTVFKNMPSILTELEKTLWKTQMNGGYTTNSVSIATIYPPIIKNQNARKFITVRGANLNLNPINFAISICTGASDPSNPIILYQVPNNQVTLLDANTLNFYINTIEIGLATDSDYKILIDNGVALYLSLVNFRVVTTVQNIDLSTINYDQRIYNNATSARMFTSGTSIVYFPDPDVKPLANEGIYIYKAKTVNPVFLANENFSLELTVQNTNWSVDLAGVMPIAAIVGFSSSALPTLLDDFFNRLDFKSNGGRTSINNNSPWDNGAINISFVKRGDTLVTLVNGYKSGVFSSMYIASTIPEVPLYFGALFTNFPNYNGGLEINIIQAYKF